MRRPLMCGNWKMNLNIREAAELAVSLVESLKNFPGVDVMVAPAFPHLTAVADILRSSRIALGAQNMCAARSGAHTGEVSPLMLRDIGVRYVILGHSERRHVYGETDTGINAKMVTAVEEKLCAILCVGETWTEREAGRMEQVVLGQLREGLKGISRAALESVVIAYEPVWAIGTGKTATPEDAQAVHLLIRKELSSLYDAETADTMRILYGGSVKPNNIAGLMAMRDIDGALVGGASLSAAQFTEIVRYAKTA